MNITSTPQQNTQSLERSPLKKRLVWSLQPLAFVFALLFWVLNPEVADVEHLTKAVLGAFALGVLIALVGKWTELKRFLDLKENVKNTDVYRKNRVPKEFYWGHKEKILFSRTK